MIGLASRAAHRFRRECVCDDCGKERRRRLFAGAAKVATSPLVKQGQHVRARDGRIYVATRAIAGFAIGTLERAVKPLKGKAAKKAAKRQRMRELGRAHA